MLTFTPRCLTVARTKQFAIFYSEVVPNLPFEWIAHITMWQFQPHKSFSSSSLITVNLKKKWGWEPAAALIKRFSFKLCRYNCSAHNAIGVWCCDRKDGAKTLHSHIKIVDPKFIQFFIKWATRGTLEKCLHVQQVCQSRTSHIQWSSTINTYIYSSLSWTKFSLALDYIL